MGGQLRLPGTQEASHGVFWDSAMSRRSRPLKGGLLAPLLAPPTAHIDRLGISRLRAFRSIDVDQDLLSPA